MQQVALLLRKLQELYDQPFEKTAIDIDLMLDYSRKLYAELLDYRGLSPADQVQISHQSAEMGKQSPAPTLTPAPPVVIRPAVAKEPIATAPSIPEEASQHSGVNTTGPAATSTTIPAPKPAPPPAQIPPTDVALPQKPLSPPQAAPSGQADQAATKSVPGKDIRKTIGINDKYQIISELFHNDKDAYETAIEEINNSDNPAEAIDWLHDHVAWNYNWNEDNYTVQLFFGLISQFFARHDG